MGREYFNNVVRSYFFENRIIHQISCMNTSQQNEVIERKNRHLLEVVGALMFIKNVTKDLWGDIILPLHNS